MPTLSGYFEYKETEPSISLPPCENVINLHKGQSTVTEFIFKANYDVFVIMLNSAQLAVIITTAVETFLCLTHKQRNAALI